MGVWFLPLKKLFCDFSKIWPKCGWLREVYRHRLNLLGFWHEILSKFFANHPNVCANLSKIFYFPTNLFPSIFLRFLMKMPQIVLWKSCFTSQPIELSIIGLHLKFVIDLHSKQSHFRFFPTTLPTLIIGLSGAKETSHWEIMKEKLVWLCLGVSGCCSNHPRISSSER